MRKNMILLSSKRILLFALLLFVTLAASAVPAKPGQHRQLTLSDGSKISAVLVGDEFGHYWKAADGKAYQEIGESQVFRPIDTQQLQQRAQRRRSESNERRTRRLSPKRVGEVGNYIGEKKGLIILVNFSDVAFKDANNNALYQRIANEKNFKEEPFKGSMYDYFYAQSETQFELTFDVVGPVTVSKKHSYYGQNDSQGEDMHPAEMVIEALKLADPLVNYADYDWNGDHTVEQVYVVYAGQGEANGGASTTIWPHEYDLTSANLYGDGSGAQTLDGVTIDTYACGSELNGDGKIDGIGTMCHEFSHCLGYPDFYDTDYSDGQGMFNWDLMDAGSYNGGGYLPAGYTSYERWVAGWKTPIELTNTLQVTGMKSLQDRGDTYIIYNGGNKNEYFLLENRQKTGWDGGLPGAGLLILHVDYNATAWENNEPNDDPNHQRMTWIPADNKYQYEIKNGSKQYTVEGAANDPFPYGNVNAFGRNTTPAAKFYNKNSDGTYYMDSSVEEITQNSGGTVSFLFKGVSNVKPPTFSPNSGRYTEAQSVTISCATEGATIYYTTNGNTPTTRSTKYTGPISVSTTTTIKAVAELDGDVSSVATATFVIKSDASPDVNTFKRVASTNDLQSGMRFIIACGSKATAAGDLSNNYLKKVDVTVSDDIITITDDVSVFVLSEQTNGYALMNESTGQYLYATLAKKLGYDEEPQSWTLANGTDGVILTYHDLGTMLYNVSSPRFLNYISNPSTSMIQANLYMEYNGGTTPIVKQDATLSFNPKTVEITLGDSFTEPMLTTNPEGIAVSYSSNNTSVASVDAQTGKVTVCGAGTATITASFEGNNSYNAATGSYTLTVNKATTPVIPVAEGDQYELVTNASTLAAGDQLLIAYVSNGKAKVMSTTQNANNRGAVDAVLNADGTLTPDEKAQVVTLEKDGGNYLFKVNGGYLYAASSSSNNLKTEKTADANAKATIAINNNGNATIIFQGSNTRNELRYNPNTSNNNPIFSCYGSTSTMSLPQLYRLVPVVTLYDTADNTDAINDNDGQTVNVKLSGRTLYKDGEWNTLCLPFDVTIADSPLAGADVRTLENASQTNGKMALTFTAQGTVTQMKAGKPYIIKWEKSSNDLVEPTFTNVTLKGDAAASVTIDGLISFTGCYAPVPFTAGDTQKLFMSTANMLYTPSTNLTLNAFRAYFELLGNLHVGGQNPTGSNAIIGFELNFDGGNSNSAIKTLTLGNRDRAWYTLDGTRLSGKPTAKGVYINNSKKVVIK